MQEQTNKPEINSKKEPEIPLIMQSHDTLMQEKKKAHTKDLLEQGYMKQENENKEITLMAIFTVVTLLALVIGWISEGLHAEESLGKVSWICYVVAYVAGGYYTIQAAWESMMAYQFDVNFLMIIAALGAAYVGEPKEGALLMFLFSLSNTLENYAMNRTKNSIRSLMALAPQKARRLVKQDNSQKIVEEIVDMDSIAMGDLVLIRPGELISVDGVITEGHSTVNEASLTGESYPVQKIEGNTVYAGTMNQSGYLKLKVRTEVEQFAVSRIIHIVQEAREKKAKSQDFTDRIIGQYYSISVCAITMSAIIIPYFFMDWDFQTTLYRAMTLMVVASPCALVISIPSAILSSMSTAAKQGVLLKGGKYMEALSKIKTLVVDKTGTLTTGNLSVVNIWVPHPNTNTTLQKIKPLQKKIMDISAIQQTLPMIDDQNKAKLLLLAGSIERFSTHPLGMCIYRSAQQMMGNDEMIQVHAFHSHAGKGVEAEVNNVMCHVGKPGCFAPLEETIEKQVETYQKQNLSVVVVSQENQIIGLIGITDTIRKEAKAFVSEVKKAGVQKVILLTGDHKQTALYVGETLGLDEVYADQMPDQKTKHIQRLQQIHPVGMIGDGINDAPSLATASVGIAMGMTGVDVAIESADVLLVHDDLSLVPRMLRLSQRTRRIIRQNMIFSFGVMISLMFLTLLGKIPLPLGVVGHEGSTLLVVLNSLRLLKRKR